MKRLLFRSMLVLLAVAVLVIAVAWLLIARSLPQLDGVIAVAGLQGSVSVERDAAGIPTITASNREDLAFATGFVHGQDRFFQMDLSRRRAAGELAELFGSAAVDVDKRIRLHRFRDRAARVLEQSTLEERNILDAYAAGVNAGLEGLASRPPEYFFLGSRPQRWRREDSVLVGYAMFLTLNDDRATRDLQRGLAHRVLPEPVYAWLYPKGSAWDAPIIGEARLPEMMPGPELFDLRSTRTNMHKASTADRLEEAIVGSNSWALSGKLTRSGRAIVANDMHLNITTPNIFYRARLIVDGEEGRDVSGITLPGTPIVVAGSNGSVAWAFTNSYGDWSDAVTVRPGSAPGTYVTPQGQQAIQHITQSINVKGEAAEQIVIRETVWGPILERQEWPDGDIAVSWIAHHAAAVNIEQLQLETATTLNEALDIANRLGIPPQNFVAGDADGNIGWTIAGRIPRRSEFDPWLPADWSVSTGWTGWYEPDFYPRVTNPESGRIWTANARVGDEDALAVIGDGGYALGARAAQIRDNLFGSDSFSVSDMLAIQTDDRALFLARWRKLLLSSLNATALRDQPQRVEFRSLVENWTARASADSVGYRLVREFRGEVKRRVFEMLVAPVRAAYDDDVKLRVSNQFEAPLWQLLSEQPAHLLSADYANWQDLLLKSVDENIRQYSDNFDGSLTDRRWGERNTAAIRHPLSFAVPMISRWLDMPREPLAGDRDMPRAQGPSFGASERFGVSPGDEVNGYLHMPGGQSGHPMSEYYRIGHDDWVQGRASHFLPGTARHRLTLTP